MLDIVPPYYPPAYNLEGGPRLRSISEDEPMLMPWSTASGGRTISKKKCVFPIYLFKMSKHLRLPNFLFSRMHMHLWFPWMSPHPLMGYEGFSPSHIKWCSMHCLNLGILQYVNGSAISLLCQLGYSICKHLFSFEREISADIFCYGSNPSNLGAMRW